MNIIVFSKNRAMQLDLFIRSFKHFVHNADIYIINVLYTYTDNNFGKGYERLKSKPFANINFLKEKSFKEDMLSLIDESMSTTVFFVDDDVFKNHIDFYDDQMSLFWNDGNILCRSLRLHPRLTYCYPARVPMKPPRFLANGVFEYRGLAGDYGYPASLDGNIFMTKEILPFLKEFDYPNPNMLENAMLQMRISKPYMVCYPESVIMNIPLNRVQTVNENICGKVSAEYLNNLYLNGKIIDLTPIKGFKNTSCHQEINLSFV